MSDKTTRLYDFGPFRLNTAERRLLREGEVVQIPPKIFDLLLALLERRGRLVEKDELLRSVWPDTVVEEANLASNISLLRKVLGENGNRFIETVPKRGYRFVAEVLEFNERIQAVSAAHKTLEEIPEPIVQISESSVPPSQPRKRINRKTLFIACAILLISGVAFAIFLFRQSARPKQSAYRRLWQLTSDSGLECEPTWSPDGSLIAYSSDRKGDFDIWVQPVGEGKPVRVTTSPAHEWQPDYSPDGKYLAFRSERDGGGIFVIPALGGTERKIADFGYRPRWAPDGSRILFVSAGFRRNVNVPRFYIVGLDEKPPREIFSDLRAEFTFAQVAWHPDSRRISILGLHRKEGWGLWTAPLEGAPVKSPIGPEVRLESFGNNMNFFNFRWSPSGREIYFEGTEPGLRNVWKVEVDPQTLEFIAGPERLTTGPGLDSDISLSQDGRKLAFAIRSERTRLWSMPFDANRGRLKDSGRPITADDLDASLPELSRDGKKLVFLKIKILRNEWKNELWEKSLDDGNDESLLASDKYTRFAPRWSRDWSRLAYRRMLYVGGNTVEYALIARDAGGKEERLITTPGKSNVLAFDWSADGNWIFGGTDSRSPRRMEIVAFPVSAAPHAETQMRFITSSAEHNLAQARLSPDERWISFNASKVSEPGTSTIYVIPATGGEWTRITTEGKYFDGKARWSPDGKTIFFISNRGGFMNVWGAPFDPKTGKPVGEPFRVTAFENPGRMILPDTGLLDLTFSADRMILPMTESSGNIWILENVDR